MSRFYNPGTAIDERLQYTHPTKDPREGSTLSYFALRVEEKDFFEVPDTLELMTPDGEMQVPVNFKKRVKLLYQSRGVILIDPRLKDVEIADDDNAAADDKEAKAKGARMWREYLRAIVAEHYTSVEETKSFGGVPRAAVGLTKYALRALNMEDPADRVDTITRAKEGQVSNAEMLRDMQAMRDRINQLEGAKSVQTDLTLQGN